MQRYSKIAAFLIINVCFSILGFAAQEAPQSFTLDGKLYSDVAATTALLDATVQLKIQILSKAQTCILYEETQTIDTSTSSGTFSIQIGSSTAGADASKRSGNDTGKSLATVFSNNQASISGKAVSNGAACTYSPSSGDVRYVRILVTPSDNTTRVLSPNLSIDSIPNAIVSERAESLQGLLPANILQVNSTAPASLTQANLENIFSTTNFPRLQTLLSVSPSNYVQNASNGATGLGSVSGDPTSPQTGQIWYDSSANAVKFYNGTAIKTVSSSTGISSIVAGTGLTGGTITSTGTIAVDVGTTAGQIVQVQTGGKLPALSAADLTSVNGSAITSGTIGGSTAVNSSGNITTSGTVTGATLSATTLKVFNGSNYLQFAAPTLSSNVSFVLPAADGTAGQVLSTDGSGNLSWATAAGSAVTAVSVTSPITDAGTATHPTIGIQQANTSQSGYLSNTDWNTFNNKLSTALNSAKIWVGNGSNVATAVSASGDVTLANDGSFSVVGVKGKTVSAVPTSSGQVLRYDGTNWTPNFLSMFDLRSTVTGAVAFGGVGCTAGQTLTWTAATDNLSCSTIAISDSQVTFASKSQNAFLAGPSSGGAGSPSFRAIASADLPSGGYDSTYFKNGGSSFGANASVGTADNYSLALKTNNVSRVTIDNAGKVGIGVSPTATLDVNGTIKSTSPILNSSPGTTAFDWSAGNIQYTTTLCSGSTWTFSNISAGTTYTLVVQPSGTHTGVCQFSDGSSTFKYTPTNATPNTNKDVVYSFFKVGTSVYVFWADAL